MGQVVPVRASITHHLLGLGILGYANWGGILFGAMTGAGRMTPLASNGTTGADLPEMLVGFLLISSA